MTNRKAQQAAQYRELMGITRRTVDKVLETHSNLTPQPVDQMIYGAVDIDPSSLAIWLLFENADALKQAKTNGTADILMRAVRATLAAEGYPAAALDGIHIGVEDNDAASKAGRWNYFR